MKRTITHAEWRKEAESLFGKDAMTWRFVCPSCGYVASVQDWKDAGAPESAVAFSCVGVWAGAKGEAFSKKAQPCNYAGGGLFKLNPLIVKHDGGESALFEFDRAAQKGGA